MKRLIPFAFLVIASLVAVAETAEVRIIRGGNCGQMETRTVQMEPMPDGGLQFRMPKGDIPADAQFIEVVPEFMRARKKKVKK